MKHLLIACLFSFMANFYFAQQAVEAGTAQVAHAGAFFENKGQWPQGVLFRTQIQGGNLWLQEGKLVYHLQDFSDLHKAHFNGVSSETPKIREEVVHVNFIGSNKKCAIDKIGKSAYYYNYILGSDSTKWAHDVHGYESVVLNSIYPGIDLRMQTSLSQTKYEFELEAGADPNKIIISYAGQNHMQIDRKGNLILKTELGNIIEQKPIAYQMVGGKKNLIACAYQLQDSIVTFKLGHYNSSLPLVIDPVLVFATYDGAISDNFGMTATYTQDGSAFSAGTVFGNNYPLPDLATYNIASNFTAVSGNYGITDVFISKYSSNGTAMLWSTFLGGGDAFAGTETAHSLICDSSDNLYIFGATSSVNFPTTAGAFQPNHAGGNAGANFLYNGVYFSNQGSDIYVSKLSANGHNLLASTYVGGASNDGVNYKITSLPYNSPALYDSLTTNYGDQFRGEIMLDENNNVLIGSCSRSANFPTVGAFQANNAGGQDAVVFKLNTNFTNLIFSSYYGGSLNDACYSIKIDTLNQMFFTGGTSSNNLPGTTNGLNPTYQGGKADGFITKINALGNTILNASYIGKTNYDQSFFVEIDRNNNIFLLGQSLGGVFPVFNATYSNPNSSQFIIKLNNALTTNLASTVIGNGSTGINISPSAFLVDICGNIYVSGWGANILQSVPLGGMPITSNAFQSTTTGFDFYLMVLERDFLGLLYATYIGGPVAHEHVDGGTSRFDKNGVVYQSVCGGCGANSDFPTSPGAWSATNNSSNCNNLIFKFDFQLIPNAQFSTNSTIGCEDFQVTFQNFSSLSDEYLWDFGNNNTTSTIFNPTVLYTEPGQYDVYLYVTDSVCLLTDTAYISITVLDSITFNLLDTINLCSSVPYTLNVSPNGTNYTYIWSLNSNFSVPLNAPQNSSILVSQAGMYYVSVSNGVCSRIDSVFVAFDIPITADFSPDVASGCTPLQVQFDNSSSVTTDFYWDFGNGIIDSVNYNPLITYNSPGQYQVQLIISDSVCNGSDTAYYTINVAPSIAVVLDDIIYLCNNTAITISPLVSGLATSFIWSTNAQFSDTLNASILDTSLLLINPQTISYYFQANNGTCSVIDSVEVQIFSDQLTMVAPAAICLGETGNVSVSNSSSETFTYSWSPLNCILNPNNGPTVNVQPTFSQYIYVEATSANNCVVNDSIFIQVSYLDSSLVIASAQPNLVLPGAQVSLLGAPSGMNSYSWSPSIGLVNPSLQNTNATVETTTIFTLTVSNGVCTRSDTTLVRVYEIICDAPYIYVPNAFSPNGDGNNDILYVRGLWVEKIIFRIFDRWGELVFESNNIANGWDGMFKDKKLPPDVYDYYLDITCVGGQQTITKGNVTLMK